MSTESGGDFANGRDSQLSLATKSRRMRRDSNNKRRETADFSSLNALLDSSTVTTGSCDNGHPSASTAHDNNFSVAVGEAGSGVCDELEEDGDGDETADFTSMLALLQSRGDSPAAVPAAPAAAAREDDLDDGDSSNSNVTSGSSLGTRSERAAAVRPRAKHHSNQKPGRTSDASRLVAPPSIPLVIGGEGGGGGGDGRGVPGPAVGKPRSPSRRPRRSINLDPRVSPATTWEDYAMPTPKPVSFLRCTRV